MIIEGLSLPPSLGKDSFSCADQTNSVNDQSAEKKALISLIFYRNRKLGGVWLGGGCLVFFVCLFGLF